MAEFLFKVWLDSLKLYLIICVYTDLRMSHGVLYGGQRTTGDSCFSFYHVGPGTKFKESARQQVSLLAQPPYQLHVLL